MRKQIPALITLGTLALVGCAASGPPEDSAEPVAEAVAQEDVVSDAAADAGEGSAQEKRICRNERVTGTHMVKRVCLTAGERKEMEDEAREAMRTLKRGSGCATPNCN